MYVPALSRLLEAIAKSIKHAMAMSMILATEIFKLDLMRCWPHLKFYWTIPTMSCDMLQ